MYRKLHAKHTGAAIMLQKNMRMRLLRRKFLAAIAATRYNSATMAQKYLKGFLVHKRYKKQLHDNVIMRLSQHFREMKQKLHTDSQIKIRHAWRLYQRRKALEAARKKAEAALKAKKGKKIKGAMRNALLHQVTQKVEEPSPAAKKGKKK